jgi:hypothetical protein
MATPPLGSGAGSHLPAPVLILSGACTALAVIVSAMSIHLQLKNYHKPILQRYAHLATMQGERAEGLFAEWLYELCSWSRYTQFHPSFPYFLWKQLLSLTLYEIYTRYVHELIRLRASMAVGTLGRIWMCVSDASLALFASIMSGSVCLAYSVRL